MGPLPILIAEGEGEWEGEVVLYFAICFIYFVGHSAVAESLSIFVGNLSEVRVLLRSGARSSVACVVVQVLQQQGVDSSMGLVENAKEKQKHILI